MNKTNDLNKKTHQLNMDISYLKELTKQVIKSCHIHQTEEKLQYSDLLLCIRETQTIAGQLKTIFDISFELKEKAERLNKELTRCKFDIKVEESNGSDLTY